MNPLVQIARRAVLGLATALLLASCGGGDPVVRFAPTRMLAFGDELSVITDTGRKYTVNGLTSDNTALDCAVSPLWIQRLASAYGLVLPQCNPLAVADPPSRIYAGVGAKVADLSTQIDTHLLTSNFSEKDLVTIMVGQNDILEQYANYDGTNEAVLQAELKTRGGLVAAQVSRVAALGGKVLISTPIDLGYSAFAIAQNTSTGDTGRSALLSRLTAKFVEGLRAGLFNESGSSVAIMLTDELVQTMAKFPSTYGMSNVVDAVCDPALAATVDQCTTQTLVTGGTAASYLWATTVYPSAGAHAYIGALAASRANGNPF